MAGKEILQKFKKIADQARQIDDRNLYGDVLSLQSDVMELLEERNELEAQNSSLKQAADVAAKVKYEAPFYWLIDAGRRDGPFCQHCWDKDGMLIRLQRSSIQGVWSCRTCKNSYR